MTRERTDDVDDLHRLLAAALQSHARDMFPDDTPVPRLGARSSTRHRAGPLVAAAAGVSAVVVAAGVLAPGASTLTPAAGGIEMAPPCNLAWADSASRTEFTVDGTGDATWRVWEQGVADRQYCLSVDQPGGGSIRTSAPRNLQMLQGAALVAVDGRIFLWGLVTPAVTRLGAQGPSGAWSATWTQSDLHVLPTALGVFVTAVDGVDRPITVTASSSYGGPDIDLEVTGS